MASEHSLELRLLGTFAGVGRSGSGERHLGKGKPVALLSFLALAPGRRASRERLATLLWSDGSSEAARQNLRQTLWYIKRRLGEVLLADDDHVEISAQLECDVSVFMALAGAAQHQAAIGAYRGEFIPDFAAPGAAAFEEWADLERRRLRATYVGCVDAAARQFLAGGQANLAAQLARRAHELAPHEQSVWRLLLECLMSARDNLGVAAEAAQFEGAIERDDVDPEPSTLAMLRTAKRFTTGNDSADAVANSDAGTLVSDLIGRDSEFRALVDAWEGTRRNRGRTLLLSGAAGLGKTRLLRDFSARIVSTRGRTLSVRAHPGNRTISGSLAGELAEQLATLPGAAAVSPGSASVLVALSPLLASLFSGAEPDRATGEDAIRRRAMALGDLVQVLTETSPLAILIDDAHWADAESVRVIGGMRSRADSSRLLFIMATRVPDDIRHVLGQVEEISLHPLDVADVAEFVSRLAIMPSEAWSTGLIPRLHQVSHGIPLLLLETLQRLIESGVLSRANGTWHATSASALAASMPMHGALNSRLSTLSPGERLALIRLATLGRPATADQLVSGGDEDFWSASLNELERRAFVARSERRVTVWHDEIARGVLDLATSDERFDAHTWVADHVLANARATSDFVLAAHHAERSGDPTQLSRVWRRSLKTLRANGDERLSGRIAEDILAPSAPTERVRAEVRRTPIGLRLGRKGWTGVAAGIVGVLGIAAAMAGPTSRSSDVVLYFLSVDRDTAVHRVAFDPSSWDTDAPLDAVRVDPSESPIPLEENSHSGIPLPDGSGWLASRFYPDSGGDEIVYIDARRVVSRPAGAPGDDWGQSVSPDGRYVVFGTRRFDRVEHQSEIAVWDRRDDSVKRLTDSPNDEISPLWSPDGTRIAFVRYYQVGRRLPELCVMGVDGKEERCEWADLPSDAVPLGWLDHSTVVALVVGLNDVYRVELRERRAVLLGRAPGSISTSLDGKVLHCSCVDPTSRQRFLAVARLDRPLDMRPVHVNGRVVDASRIVVASAPRVSRYLDRIALSTGDSSISLDATDAIRVTGTDANGGAIQVSGIRFESRDPLTLGVDPDGTLRPRVLGRTWIVATAGGWRSDSLAIAVVAPNGQTVHVERWDQPIDHAWVAFGDPLPLLVGSEDRRALLTNGDGVYPSGLYLRQAMNTSGGVGVEVLAQLPVTKGKMQSLNLTLFPSPRAEALAAWDHVSGAGPLYTGGGCVTAFPSTEGALGVARFVVGALNGGPDIGFAPTDSNFYGMQWHRLRLQHFPDGRCGLAVDGVPVAVTAYPGPSVERMMVSLSGHTVGAQLLVREVEVWEGVRGDVRWTPPPPAP